MPSMSWETLWHLIRHGQYGFSLSTLRMLLVESGISSMSTPAFRVLGTRLWPRSRVGLLTIEANHVPNGLKHAQQWIRHGIQWSLWGIPTRRPLMLMSNLCLSCELKGSGSERKTCGRTEGNLP